jgi:hypothetical protein
MNSKHTLVAQNGNNFTSKRKFNSKMNKQIKEMRPSEEINKGKMRKFLA